MSADCEEGQEASAQAAVRPKAKSDDYEDSYFDEGTDEQEDSEYVGPTDQKPLVSKKLRTNLARNRHAAWNTYYQPFNLFPATPFDSQPVLQDAHFRTAMDDFSVRLNKVRSRLTLNLNEEIGRILESSFRYLLYS